jgi:glycosyltransferase involved in cell wall biosynthesis
MTAGPRILVCADSLHGGLGTIAAAHIDALRASGATVRVLAGASATSSAGEVWSLPEQTADVPGMLHAGQQVRDLARVFRPDAVHCHGARAGLAAALGMAGLRRRPRVTVHTALPTTLSEAMRAGPRGWAVAALPALLPRPAAVTPTRLPGWDFTPVLSPAADVAPVSPPDEVPTDLLWIGRLDPPKRLDLFLALADQLADLGLISGVRVIGSGTQRSLLDEYSRSGRAQLTVHGFSDNPWAETTGSEIVAVLSDSEAVPLVLQEAMARGHLVVASRLPGIEWLAGDSVVYWDGADGTAQRLASMGAVERNRLRGSARSTLAGFASRLGGVETLVDQTLSEARAR